MYRPELVDLVYMAGLFDGEGYISIRYQSQHKRYDTYSLMVGVNMVDEEPVKLFSEAFGGTVNLRESKNKNWRPQYRWRIDSGSAYRFLKIISPYLRLKQKKAELALLFQENKKTYNYRPQDEKDKESLLFTEMRVLNRRGNYAIST